MSNESGAYAPLMQPRFRVETAPDGSQRIVIPAPRAWFVMAFMTVWLCGWTVGGVAAVSQLLRHFQPFLAFWLCAWALGEAFALTTVCWMAAGREALRPVGGDLEISAEVFGLARRKLYRGRDIIDLSPSIYVRYGHRYGRQQINSPLLGASNSGSVKFSYGARTVYAGAGLDEAEGRLIVEWLKPRLAKSA